MGLLDALTSIAGGASPEHHGVADALSQVMQEHPGGMDGILNQLKQNGLADQVQSWISPGENKALARNKCNRVSAHRSWKTSRSAQVSLQRSPAESSPWFYRSSFLTCPGIVDSPRNQGGWPVWRARFSAANPNPILEPTQGLGMGVPSLVMPRSNAGQSSSGSAPALPCSCIQILLGQDPYLLAMDAAGLLPCRAHFKKVAALEALALPSCRCIFPGKTSRLEDRCACLLQGSVASAARKNQCTHWVQAGCCQRSPQVAGRRPLWTPARE